ncbi:MAG TPA: CPBP family intramembrane glutamic endopeptidase, partial [Parachlamydiaceae bacterium]|nr:CPBP family intramembrane glutamic endopeptidase [Parachlamydiaceae bacterium]
MGINTNFDINSAKHFSIGLVSSLLLSPIAKGAVYLAEITGLIAPEVFSMADHWKQTAAAYAKGNITIDAERIINTTCPLQEFVTQLNHNSRNSTPMSVYDLKKFTVLSSLPSSIIEELIFRGLVQDVLLKRIPQFIINKVAPGNEHFLDTKIAKVARIVLTASLFSAAHLSNKGIYSDAFVNGQVVATFV